jgi:photosynthetic reaction center cytochrome c subunit
MNSRALGVLACVGVMSILVSACEPPPTKVLQHGYRGTGMDEIYNSRALDKLAASNAVPVAPPAAVEGGPPATSVFKNLQVLDDLSVAQVSRLMVSMTAWVAPPGQSCNYCHVADLAADDNYHKVVARSMLRMVRHLNSGWKNHVGTTGVTCYTCHRGMDVPAYVWYRQPPQTQTAEFAGDRDGQNAPAAAVGLTSLPNDPFSEYLDGQATNIRVVATEALPGGDPTSTKQTEHTYALMIHMSTALGVNCTYCHNSRSFTSWDSSTPQRATAWYGIRMVRDLNAHYLEPLTPTLPPDRKGPLGDPAKVNCQTCHQGVYKPLFGVSMLKDYPELAGPVTTAATTSAATTN